MPTTLGPIITAPATITRMYGEGMLKDVPADKAARFATPGGVKVVSNHPVFVFGHLALYNRRIMAMCNQPEGAAAVPGAWDDLFKQGAECKDDPSGSLYPSRAEVSKAYFAGLDAAVAATRAADDATLLLPNPAEGRFKEILPTRGSVIAFLLAGHPMSHFGQVSAWRRMMGLRSAM